ncbi:hypothetical protein Mesau_05589 [Mesorhizobium australicum WSM2073]|uniref:Uncharacterized protein n=3 Tax=Mesorhizobium TaxID=68287 RepID=L0KVA2_MESAW|nr:hypothetical protein Mesci_5541 [Mesorhizobium ciceri biovar biserrulae WSM1271]AGB47894.1 hypothetical protein Mesau_05589 [Mesorhizobium australicum WSM2073]
MRKQEREMEDNKLGNGGSVVEIVMIVVLLLVSIGLVIIVATGMP